MLRSLYTGISGMRSHQTMMDVTGNNIANVNTTGYKTANTIFEDTLSQTLANAAAPQGAKGGTNPAQVGLGVRVAGITTNFTQGATQTTGRNSDMLIDGDGFFVVNNNGVQQYTRAGAFNVDGQGNLVNLAGAKVMGWKADAAGNTNTASAMVPVQIPASQVIPARQSQVLNLGGRLDNTVEITGTAPGPYTADPTATQTMTYNVFDSKGVAVPLTAVFTPNPPSGPIGGAGTTGLVMGWKVDVYQGSADPANLKGTLNLDSAGNVTGAGGSGATTTAGNNTVSFAGFTAADGTPFAPALKVDFDDIVVTNRADTSQSDVHALSQDGYAAGSLVGWKVGPDGAVTGTFDNGRSLELGKIAVAVFDNPSGLEKLGGSTFGITSNSGEPNIGSAGDGAHGGLVSGALEMSNVDLAQEFTNLIVSQRGFQANSRVITSSDEMLQELVNLKR